MVDEKLEVPVGDTVIVSGWGGRSDKKIFTLFSKFIYSPLNFRRKK